MKFLSHTHINGNGRKYRNEYARILARAAKQRGYNYVAVGCHGDYIASNEIMNIIWDTGIYPVRFAELDVGIGHYRAHVSAINIPNRPIEGYVHKPKTPVSLLSVLPYLREVGAKIVLNHPRSLGALVAFSAHIDGYEIKNGAHHIDFKGENPGKMFPDLVQFTGADYHVWKCKGNIDYYTELPDSWFGRLYK